MYPINVNNVNTTAGRYTRTGTLTIMCGLPRSGKSTYARMLQLNHDYVIVSPDAVRRAYHGKSFDAAQEDVVWTTVKTMVRALLIQGHNVVVDACNVSKHRRELWVRMARETGEPLTIYVLNTPKTECLARNIDLVSGNHLVPVEVIERMSRNYSAPSAAEGIVLHVVEMG